MVQVFAGSKAEMNTDIPVIDIGNLTVGYSGREVLSGFSLRVADGECVAITGESGCGKSTLLHCVCELIPRSINAAVTGSIKLFDRPVAEIPRHELASLIGIVFQNPETQLFCDTVEDELAFGLENICLPREIMELRINEMLALIGLDRYRLTSPEKLSGGQKQLVALAAVLALRPKILLLDEAFAQLDESVRERLLGHVRALRGNHTIMMVDHDADNLTLADRIVIIGGNADGE